MVHLDAKVFVVQERKPGKFAGKMMDVELSREGESITRRNILGRDSSDATK